MMLRKDGDKWALHCVSGNVENTAATNSLELGWSGPLSSALDLLVVKVEQYVICLWHLLL